MNAPPRLFIGCASDSSPEKDLGDLIAEVARATIPGPYSLHGHPAVHAYAVVEHADGIRWRLDGQAPRARWAPWWAPRDPTRCGLWELRLKPEAVAQGIHKARQLDGTPYDGIKLVAQLVRCVARRAWIPGADICTGLALKVMTACDTMPEGICRTLPDEQPERLCQALHHNESAWWLRREA